MPLSKKKANLREQLAAYSTLATAFLAIPKACESQVLYTAVNPNFTSSDPYSFGGQNNFYRLDLDQDGTDDFQIQVGSLGSFCTHVASGYSSCFSFGKVTVKALNDSGSIFLKYAFSAGYYTNPFIQLLQLNDEIDSKEKWIKNGVIHPNYADEFLGLRLEKAGHYYYGWLRIYNGNGTLFTVYDYAIQQQPDDSIKAGEGYDCSLFKLSLLTPASCIRGSTFDLNYMPYTGLDSVQWFKNGLPIDNYYGFNTGNYYVVAKNYIYGCWDTSNVVTLTDKSFINTPVISVRNDSLISSPAATYQWFQGDHEVEGATTRNHSPPVDGLYTVKITDQNGCEASAEDNYQKCEEHIQLSGLSPVKDCVGGLFPLATNAVGLSFTWLLNGVPYSVTSESSILPLWNGVYQVIMLDNNHCFDTSNTVTEASPLQPPTIYEKGDTLYSSPEKMYQWYLNGNIINGATSSSFIPQEMGLYKVSSADSGFCPAYSEGLKEIKCNLLKESVEHPLGYCNVLQVVPSFELQTFQWYFNSNIIEAGNSPGITADSAGIYTVVIGIDGQQCKDTLQYDLSQSRIPVIFQRDDTIFCTVSYGNKWILNNQMDSGAFFIPQSIGTVNFTHLDSNGCQYNLYYGYWNCSKIEIMSTAIRDSNCGQLNNASLYINYPYITDSIHYQWMRNDSLLLNQTSYSLNAFIPGEYQVIVSTDGGCYHISSPFTINYYQRLPAPFVTERNDTLFTIAGYNYQWYKDGNAIPGATNLFLTAPLNDGVSSVTISDSNGCTASSGIYHAKNCSLLPKEIHLNTNSDTSCDGMYIPLSIDDFSDQHSYQWYKDNKPIAAANSTSYYATSSGSYRAVIYNGDCCDDTTNEIQLTFLSLPSTPVITRDRDTLFASNGSCFFWFQPYNLNSPLGYGNKFIPVRSNTYVVRSTDTNSCYAMSQPYNYVDSGYQAETFFISANFPALICGKGNCTLTISPIPYNDLVEWLKNDTVLSSQNQSTLQASLPGYYKAIILKGASNDTTNTVYIQGAPPPSKLQITTLHDTLFSPPGISYQWQSGNNILSTLQWFYPPDKGNYSLTLIDSNGCAVTKAFNYNECSRANAAINEYGTCSYPIQLNAEANLSFLGSTVLYKWLLNDSVIPDAEGGLFYAYSGGNYQLIISNGNNCSDTSAIFKVTIDTPSQPPIFRSGDTLYTNKTGTYIWNNGSTQEVSGLNFYIPTSNDVYCLSLKDSNGCYSPYSCVSIFNCDFFDSSELLAGTNPQLSCNSSYYLNYRSKSYYLVSLALHPVYIWLRNDVPFDTTEIPELKVNQSGIYSFKVTADSTSCFIKNQTLILDTLPDITVNNSHDTLFTQQLPYSYFWTLNGGILPGETSFYLTNLISGSYSVNIYDSLGCYNSNEAYLLYSGCRKPELLNGCNFSQCSYNDPFTLETDNLYGYTYQWTLNNAAVYGATNNTLVASQPGAYRVILYGTSCADTSDPISIIPPFSPRILVRGDTLLLSGFKNYQWYYDATIVQDAVDSVYIARKSGSYYAIVTTDANCQEISDTVQVVITGLKDHDDGRLSIFPNPNSGYTRLLTYELQPGSYMLSIANAYGNLIVRQMVSVPQYSMQTNDWSFLSPGLYEISLCNSSGCSHTKMIIVK